MNSQSTVHISVEDGAGHLVINGPLELLHQLLWGLQRGDDDEREDVAAARSLLPHLCHYE